VFAATVLADLHHHLTAFCGEFGRPSVDPELMIRMLLYVTGTRELLSIRQREARTRLRSTNSELAFDRSLNPGIQQSPQAMHQSARQAQRDCYPP